MLHEFYFGVGVPHLGRKVYFRELTIRQLKDTIKTILNNDDSALSACFNTILKTNCKEDVDTLDLTTFDRFMILLNMQVVSIGGEQKLQVTCDDTKKEFSVTQNYNLLIEQLEKIDLDKPKMASAGSFSIAYGLPLANRVFASMKESEFIKLASCIRRLIIAGKEYDISSLDLYEFDSIINNLPKTLTDDILFYLDQQEKKINTVKFIDIENPYTNKKIEQILSLEDDTLNRIIKLAFKEDLHALYKSIYYMVHVLRFTPEYVEDMTVNEKQIFWSYFLADEAEKQKGQKDKGGTNFPIQDATQDFLKDM